MGKVLGLDLGISAVGWAIIDDETGDIIDLSFWYRKTNMGEHQ